MQDMGAFREGLNHSVSIAWDDSLTSAVYGFLKIVAGETFMPVLKSKLDVAGSAYAENRRAMEALLEDLHSKTAKAAIGGSERSRERHLSRGKLLPRDRVEKLLDPGTPFLEVGALAANGMYDDEAPGAGVITGVGRVEGRECVIVCNDATVKGGAYYPITVKKHLRAPDERKGDTANRGCYGIMYGRRSLCSGDVG